MFPKPARLWASRVTRFTAFKSWIRTVALKRLLTAANANVKNRVDESIEKAVLDYAINQPAHGQHRTSDELRKQGIFVSGSGVRSIWVRHGVENFKKRLQTLEAKVAAEGILLTDSQIAALERKK